MSPGVPWHSDTNKISKLLAICYEKRCFAIPLSKEQRAWLPSKARQFHAPTQNPSVNKNVPGLTKILVFGLRQERPPNRLLALGRGVELDDELSELELVLEDSLSAHAM